MAHSRAMLHFLQVAHNLCYRVRGAFVLPSKVCALEQWFCALWLHVDVNDQRSGLRWDRAIWNVLI